uniref:FCS-type domain-containing protein n=1 Tax=Sparus aurata TaxID=8175 RepID=A0A671WDL0_SPAAU
MENPRDLVEHPSRKRRDSFGMLDGLEEDRSSCSTESSGGSGASSPEDSDEEELGGGGGGGGGVTQLSSSSSSLTLIKTNGQVYTYPDGKAGMATCEMCGMVGVRDAFYSKTKRFCSVSCSRSYSSNSKKASILARLQGKPPTKKAKVLQKQPLMTKLAAYAQHQAHQHSGVKKSIMVEVFDWGRYLGDGDVIGAPVSCFKHVQMWRSWGDISEGVRVEVPNTDCVLPMKVYWIAGIIKLAGFKALLRYEGFDSDSSRDFWLNLCVPDIHPVGWCAAGGKPLVPPQTILHRFTNWKTFLIKRLTGSKTLPPDFSSKVQDSMQVPFKKQMRVEVVDKTHLCRTRVALVEQVIGGRLRLVYEECEDGTDDFWCHMYSPLIHSIGWSRSIGHRFKRSDVSKKPVCQTDAPGQLFAKVKEVDQTGSWFEDGMKLEAIDPLNLSAICVATVRKVLADGYLMIGIDGSEAADGSDWFCYHSTSPSIFPSGFCEINNIELTPPRGTTCWCYPLVLPAGATRWCYPLVRPAGVTRWCYPLVLPAGATRWCYPLVLPAGATRWCYPLVLPADATSWCYPLVLPAGVSCLCYQLVVLLGGVTWWCYPLVLPAGATRWCYPLVLPTGVTCLWCYLVVLPAGVTCWCYLLVLLGGVTWWCYLLMLPVCGVTWWCYLLVLTDGVTCLCYLLVLPAGVTWWCYLLVLPAGVTCWCYLVVLLGGVTCWCYLLVLPAGVTRWCYLVVLLGGVTCWCYLLVLTDGVKVVLPGGITWWCYLVVLPAGVTWWCYLLVLLGGVTCWC